MLSLRFDLNLQCRLNLVQKLGLESEYLGTFLTKTEMALKSRRYQKGLKLIQTALEDDNVGGSGEPYRSVVDALLGAASPSWKRHIAHWYQHKRYRLGHAATWEDIQEMDEVLVQALRELAAWREAGAEDLVLDCYMHFVGGRICKAPTPGMGLPIDVSTVALSA